MTYRRFAQPIAVENETPAPYDPLLIESRTTRTMLFNSVAFLLFYPLVTLGFYALPHRARWAWLLAASCAFYMAFVPAYILILALTIVVDYAAALYIDRTRGAARRALFIGSLLCTCLILFVFKYYDFAAASVTTLAGWIGWNYSAELLGILLPIGLSFHTFQSLSYVIEVYWGKQMPERHFGIYSLYVMFYPQLVAGPIERPQNLLHQFHEPKSFDYDTFTSGLRLMLWGFFKKVVIADNLAAYVNDVYARPATQSGSALLIACFFFSFQIYCDFSGYSDIARGSARTMGFELMRNFDRPYSAASVAEFWRRWHISLSTWFKDYVFVPLGGSRGAFPLRARNLMVVFVLSGVWHGANWTFVLWGVLHGALLVASTATESLRQRVAQASGLARAPGLRRFYGVLSTFALVSIAWVFFRAPTLADALAVLRGIANLASYSPSDLTAKVVLCFGLIGFLELAQRFQGALEIDQFLARRPLGLRWSAYVALTLGILYFGAREAQDFIYFQF